MGPWVSSSSHAMIDESLPDVSRDLRPDLTSLLSESASENSRVLFSLALCDFAASAHAYERFRVSGLGNLVF